MLAAYQIHCIESYNPYIALVFRLIAFDTLSASEAAMRREESGFKNQHTKMVCQTTCLSCWCCENRQRRQSHCYSKALSLWACRQNETSTLMLKLFNLSRSC